MREFIKENNAIPLFFFHLLFPVFEVISKIAIPGLNASILLASTVGIAHIAIISQIYMRSTRSESLNYLLSLGKTRASIFKELITMYAREIIIYTVMITGLMFITKTDHILLYMGVRLLYAFITVPVFLNNLIDVNPTSLAFLSLYVLLSRQNLWILVLVSLPVSFYLIMKFKKQIKEGSLI